MNAAKLVFYFNDPIEFLNAYFQEKKKVLPRFSLREWARQLGYENPSMLFQVLREERRLKMDLALKLAANIQLQGKPLRYFEVLVLHKASQSSTEKYVFETMLAQLRPSKLRETCNISYDFFTAYSDPLHWMILEMVKLPDFSPDPVRLHQRLGVDIDKKNIKFAWDRLVQLGLVVTDAEGNYQSIPWEEHPQIKEHGIPIDAAKKYQTQMMERARSLFEFQSIDDMVVQAKTLSFDHSQLNRVEQILLTAVKEIEMISRESQGSEVYQINTQFFRLTGRKKSSINSTLPPEPEPPQEGFI